MSIFKVKGRGYFARGMVLAAIFLSFGPGGAAGSEKKVINISPDIVSEVDQRGTELADIFGDICLMRFPDMAAFAEGAKKRQLVPMSPEKAREYLHEDPGSGWFLKVSDGTYAITIENPPYRACAVRRAYEAAPKFQFPYQLILKTWAANNDIGPLPDQPARRQSVNGLTVTATMHSAAAPDGRSLQNFMALVTQYPTGQSEVRLVRQIMQK